ncbi:hypothetical protein RUM44_006085 [Polyplax serrata]|uniref:Uncharacterized protein n=1 Tax=Polyplax serrata TaxID=468196 RepID=A0ABR1AZD9_POLSC
MFVLSLISAPLGYCRVDQKYALDIPDFLLVEILMMIFIIILAKSIFVVRLSKLRFCTRKTAEAVKFLQEVISQEIKTEDSKTVHSTSQLKKSSEIFLTPSCLSNNVQFNKASAVLSRGNSKTQGATEVEQNTTMFTENETNTPSDAKSTYDECNSSLSNEKVDNSCLLEGKTVVPAVKTTEDAYVVPNNTSSTSYSVSDDMDLSGTTYTVKFNASRMYNVPEIGVAMSQSYKCVSQPAEATSGGSNAELNRTRDSTNSNQSNLKAKTSQDLEIKPLTGKQSNVTSPTPSNTSNHKS